MKKSHPTASIAARPPRLGPALEQIDRTSVLFRGRKLIYFGGCDYHRLSSHPGVLRAMQNSLRADSLNVAASRVTTGNHPLYVTAEKCLAQFFDAPAALLAASGYGANIMLGQALAGEFTHALIDERAHGSLGDAAQFLQCPVREFSHRDIGEVRAISKRIERGSRLLLLTDGMFSHDGSVAPLKGYLEVLPHNARIFVDDAHAAGVLGEHGRGSIELEGVNRERIVQTATLSKAFGVYGGVILVPREVGKKVVEQSRMFSGNTPLPPPLLTAAMESLRTFAARGSLLVKLRANATYVKNALRDAGFPMPEHPGPIVSVAPPSPRDARRLRSQLLRSGVYPSFIQYPGGPKQGYFRFAISSAHSRPQLARLVAGLTGS